MIVQIRQSVFETNSSSTHSVSVCYKKDWEDFKTGKKWLCPENFEFLDKDKAILENKKMLNNFIKNGGDEEEFISDNWFEIFLSYDDYYEYMPSEYYSFDDETTLSDGKKVISFGYYSWG